MLRRIILLGLILAGCARMASAEMKNRVGVGVHYYHKLNDIDFGEIEEDGLGWMITYQLRTGALLSFEADVEMLPEGFGGGQEVYAPKAYVIVGGGIYGAVGIGMYYSDGEFANDPFYALRAGIDLAILPFLYLDINAEYRFENWDTLDGSNIDTDTLELGAAARLEF